MLSSARPAFGAADGRETGGKETGGKDEIDDIGLDIK
jgi:hypothetical protein